jgi:hypothetical protein
MVAPSIMIIARIDFLAVAWLTSASTPIVEEGGK